MTPTDNQSQQTTTRNYNVTPHRAELLFDPTFQYSRSRYILLVNPSIWILQSDVNRSGLNWNFLLMKPIPKIRILLEVLNCEGIFDISFKMNKYFSKTWHGVVPVWNNRTQDWIKLVPLWNEFKSAILTFHWRVLHDHIRGFIGSSLF